MDTTLDLYRAAQGWLREGQPREAVRLLELAEERSPGEPAVRRLLARALFDFAALGRAEELARGLVAADPSDAGAALLLGRTLQRRGDAEAGRWLRLAAAMDPVLAGAGTGVLRSGEGVVNLVDG
ncbi:hypothetical protein NUM3379_15850 [Kineococcus sp. NUM-3379]